MTSMNGLNVAVSGLTTIGNNVYAGTYSEGVVETTNSDGLNWQVLNTPVITLHNTKLTSSNSNLFALEPSQMIFSTDGGLTWTSRGDGGSTMAVSNDVIYIKERCGRKLWPLIW